MKRIILYCLLLIVTTQTHYLLGQGVESKHPNVILFIADDVGWNDLGCYGNQQVSSPNIDRLAEKGLRFTNFYLTASSCSPSRCSIISGRYPHNTGAAELHTALPQSIITFPALLKEAGYYVAHAGKWHLGENARRGFNVIHDKREQNGDGGELLRLTTLKNRPKGQPFFMWFASYDSHRPWGPNNFTGTNNPGDIRPPVFMANSPVTRLDLSRYYDEISRFDFYIGRVIEELKREGEAENTIIVIISDNGSPFPRAKTRTYDSGMKTFFIVTSQNAGYVKKGVSTSLVSAIDIAPTILDLAGISPASNFQGRTFKDLLKDPSMPFRNYVFSEHNWHDYEACERMVRTKDYLYNLNYRNQLSNPGPADVTSSPSFDNLRNLRAQGKLNQWQEDIFKVPRLSEELFDCRTDSLQLYNVATQKKFTEVRTRLNHILNQWSKETNDSIPDSLTGDWFDRDNGEPLKGKKLRGTMPGGKNALTTTNGGPF